jgi:rhomboid family GlyGly-CTERM serine protease
MERTAELSMFSIHPLEFPWRSASIVLWALLIYALAGAAPDAWVLHRGMQLAAQPWGLITGHLAHSDAGHLLWDGLGLLLVGMVYEPLLGKRYCLVIASAILVIDIAFLACMPAYQRYCGLSGLINALVGAGLVAAMGAKDCWAAGFGLLVLGKVLAENLLGTALLTNTAWPALQAAHLAGMLAGMLAGIATDAADSRAAAMHHICGIAQRLPLQRIQGFTAETQSTQREAPRPQAGSYVGRLLRVVKVRLRARRLGNSAYSAALR